MRIITCLIAIVVVVSAVAFAAERKQNFGFGNTADLRIEGYDFEFIKAEPDENHWRMGYFKFRWKGTKPIQLWGFGFERDGSFRVRFENFSKRVDGNWKEVEVGYCGTGSKMFSLEPGKDYIFQIPLWPYLKDGDKGVVMLGGDKISVISKPFEVSKLREIR